MTGPFSESSSHEFTSIITSLSPLRTVVWDFDGVVADTEPLHDASYRLLAERRGWSPPEGYFMQLVGKTEDAIWADLADSGFPLSGEPLPELLASLKAERKAAYVDAAEASLAPSWVARKLMPAFADVAEQQVIVSNGDPEVIESLMDKWELSPYVHVARRGAGEDKAALVEQYCTPGSVLLEDNEGWLRMGRRLGAITIGVTHEYNRQSPLVADHLLAI